MLTFAWLLLTATTAIAAPPGPAAPIPASLAADRPRLIVLTDIGGDPDDQQSMIRLMLYSNQFQIEGLVASASGTPGELQEATTRPQLIAEIVQAYGRVRPNLSIHAAGYPDANELLARIKSGNPQRGREAIGQQHDTEGSAWIIRVVDRPDQRPVNIAIWGGQTDLAQALWRVRAERGEQGLRQFVAKLRIYDIADQDGIAEWMIDEFPGMFYLLAKAAAGADKRTAVFRGMYLGGDQSLVSRDWMDTHIRHDHGPLGALYPPRTWTAPNPHSAIKEGDTPSWFYFLPQGINDPNHPEWGSWGGRFARREDGVYIDAVDSSDGQRDARTTVSRWRRHFQNDFQARLDWCVADTFAAANHPPVAVLGDDASTDIVHLHAEAATEVRLTASHSHDPDGDALQGRWSVYPEAGSYRGSVQLPHRQGLDARFSVPADAAGQTIHLLLEVHDQGTPRLTTMRRAVIAVR